MKLLVIDNYDSFTYNLVYLLRQRKVDFEVHRNDKITPDDATAFQGILLSPGPGIPEEAGQMSAIIEHCAGMMPMLGICLGHQALAQYLGGEILNMKAVYHGIQSTISLTDNPGFLFQDMPLNFEAGRYHSWEVSPDGLPSDIEITAVDEHNRIMAIQHIPRQIFGLQFHPESIMTPIGPKIIDNFIYLCYYKSS